MPQHGAGSLKGRPAPAGVEERLDPGVKRAHVFDAAMRQRYVDLVRAGVGLRHAAQQLEFTMDTVRNARKASAEFNQAVEDAEEEMVEFAEMAVMQAARAGEMWAIKYLLNNRAGRRWREQPAGAQVTVQAENAAVLVQGDPQERSRALERFQRELEARREALEMPEVAGEGGGPA